MKFELILNNSSFRRWSVKVKLKNWLAIVRRYPVSWIFMSIFSYPLLSVAITQTKNGSLPASLLVIS